MRFSTIVLAYFVCGAMLWAGGVVDWNEAGVGQMFVEATGTDFGINEETANNLKDAGGPIREAAGTFTGGLLAVLTFINNVMNYLVWPITALKSLGAPPRVYILFGGSMVVGMFGAFLRIVRGSA